MPSSRPALSYDVFVAPSKQAKAPPPRAGDPLAWDPTTSTLIFGARDAVLVDTLMTVREATALADWIELHDRRLTTIYITHGRGDHYSGLSVVLDRFPDARAVATAGTVEQMRSGSSTQHANGSPASTSWPRSSRPPSSPATRTRPGATRPRSSLSPGATSNTTESYVRQASPTGACSTPW